MGRAGEKILVEGTTDDDVFCHVSEREDGSFYVQIQGRERKIARHFHIPPNTRRGDPIDAFLTEDGHSIIASGYGPADLDNESLRRGSFYSPEVSARMHAVEVEAHRSIVRNRPMPTETPNDLGEFGGSIVTNNVGAVAHDVLRAAIKAGVVVPKSEAGLYHLARVGSASHSDTPRVLREALSR